MISRGDCMETEYFDYYSHELQRNMPIKVYGYSGKPVLFIPCQDGHFYDFENFHMTDIWQPWIDDGQCMVFAINTIDEETWSAKDRHPYDRIRLHERWINYITREAVPFIREITNMCNGWDGYPGIMTFGASMGATHALNLYLRFPDLFDRCLALSGVYNASFFLGDYMDEVVYQNSVTDYLGGMQPGHPFIEKYNQHRAVVCVGQGAWEIPESTRYVDWRFKELGINIWVDYWGYDVEHDWPWWYKQVPYFLPYLLG